MPKKLTSTNKLRSAAKMRVMMASTASTLGSKNPNRPATVRQPPDGFMPSSAIPIKSRSKPSKLKEAAMLRLKKGYLKQAKGKKKAIPRGYRATPDGIPGNPVKIDYSKKKFKPGLGTPGPNRPR